MQESAINLTLEFLGWIARQPRTYADVMEAWRSTCPRTSIYEDALRDGLIQLRPDCNNGSTGHWRVILTPRGKARLDAKS